MRTYLIIILILIVGCVDAAKITVGRSGEDYSQIQQAIDNASTGDVVEVHSGIYQENVYVSKTLALNGVDTGKGLPIVDAGGSGSAITLMANNTTLKSFRLTNSGHCGCGNAGISVKSGNNTIADNIIYGNKYGIYVSDRDINNTFISNKLIGNNITSYDSGGNNWLGNEEKDTDISG
jgi:parallel beta-helix repeat protein